MNSGKIFIIIKLLFSYWSLNGHKNSKLNAILFFNSN